MLIPMVIFNNNSGLFCDNIPGISHSLHTCTSATSCPPDTSQGSGAHLTPTQDLGWALKRDAQESSHLDAAHPFPSFPPALAGLHLPQCHSTHTRALLCSHQGKTMPWSSSHLADTLRKAMPDPPDTKAQHKNLLLALPSCQPHL